MRILAFRAWLSVDGLSKKMIYNYQDTLYEEQYGFNNENVEIMQFINRKDKNGKNIYEGDVCRCKDNELWKVVSDKERFILEGITDYGVRFLGKDLEVIGNIHENPELLEV